MMYMIAILIGWYEFPTDCPSALQPITAQHLVRDKNGYWHLVYIDQDSVIYAFSNTEGSYWTKERIAGGSNEWLRCGVALIDNLRPLVIYTQKDGAHYWYYYRYKRPDGTWSSPSQIGMGHGDYAKSVFCDFFTFDLDATNTLWFCHYRKRGWQPQEFSFHYLYPANCTRYPIPLLITNGFSLRSMGLSGSHRKYLFTIVRSYPSESGPWKDHMVCYMDIKGFPSQAPEETLLFIRTYMDTLARMLNPRLIWELFGGDTLNLTCWDFKLQNKNWAVHYRKRFRGEWSDTLIFYIYEGSNTYSSQGIPVESNGDIWIVWNENEWEHNPNNSEIAVWHENKPMEGWVNISNTSNVSRDPHAWINDFYSTPPQQQSQGPIMPKVAVVWLEAIPTIPASYKVVFHQIFLPPGKGDGKSGPQTSNEVLAVNDIIDLHPCPFSKAVYGELVGSIKTPKELTIYDLSGRVINTIPVITKRFEWDGCDRNGQEVPSGIYFFQLRDRNRFGRLVKVVKVD